MSSEAARRRDPLVRPCLKWAGGKRQLLPEIRKRLPDNLGDLRYYEPFVGAGALFLDRQPRRAVVNDNNEQLVLTYRAIRDQVDELVAALNAHRERDSEEYYYRIREQDRDSEKFAGLSAVQKAARLIYLNKTCYNGLYRVNSQGLFNVPYGRHSDPRICDEPVLRAIHGYLNCESAEIEILNGDFEAAVETAGQGAFVYFDPPYHGPGNNSFTGYQAGGFGEDEQRRLRDVFARLTAAGARCLLSNSDTPFVRELYSDEGFEIVAVKARRAINSDGAGRGAAAEVLVKNWK